MSDAPSAQSPDMPVDDSPEAPEVTSATGDVDRDAAKDMARQAMERARASARQRGAYRRSPQAARRQLHEKRRDSQPFSPGRDPQDMSHAVEAFLARMGWSEQIKMASVIGRWRDVVGDQLADKCEAVSFDDGVLVVKAESTAWATQLQHMNGQIRHRVNEELGRELVRELKILGPTARSWNRGPRRVKGRGPRDTYG